MEGVEDIPGTALAEGIRWEWESFPEYLDALERMPRALDVGAQVPHGAVRAYVMGERGAKNEQATPEEIAAMAALVRDGAARRRARLLDLAHDPAPREGRRARARHDRRATTSCSASARALGEVGHGVLEVACDLAPEGQELALDARARRARPGGRSRSRVSQSPIDPEQWRRLLAVVDEAPPTRGARLDAAGRAAARGPAARASRRRCTRSCSTPPTRAVARCRAPSASRALARSRRARAHPRRAQPDLSALPARAPARRAASHKMFPLGDPPDYEPAPERSVAALAARARAGPHEVAYDLMLERDGQGLLYLPILGYANGDLDAIREMLLHPRTVLRPRPTAARTAASICDASMPTFLLTHWVRDRSRGARIAARAGGRAARRGDTAALYGLDDRGVLAPGLQADVNVIDFERLQHRRRPRWSTTCPPAGGASIQRVAGYRYTIQRGAVTYEDGEPTGALPGRLVRGPQRAATQRRHDDV